MFFNFAFFFCFGWGGGGVPKELENYILGVKVGCREKEFEKKVYRGVNRLPLTVQLWLQTMGSYNDMKGV